MSISRKQSPKERPHPKGPLKSDGCLWIQVNFKGRCHLIHLSVTKGPGWVDLISIELIKLSSQRDSIWRIFFLQKMCSFFPKYNYKASFTETNVAFFSVKIVFNVILLASKHSELSKLERSPDLTWKAPKGVVVVTIWESLAGKKERRWKDRVAAKSLFNHAPLPPTSFRHLPPNSQGNKRILHTALVFLYPKLTEALGLKAEEKEGKNCFSHSS